MSPGGGAPARRDRELPGPRLHGDTLAEPGMLDFAVSVWPGPRPAALHAALARGLADGARYPDERAARSAIAARHARSTDEVLLTNGACDALWLIAQALRPPTAAVIHPGFSEPEAALLAADCDVVHVLLEPERWRLDPAAVPDRADCVVVANPNNPTGTLEAAAELRTLARAGRLLVVDESFIDFVGAEDASLARERDVPGLIVVRSLTKLWSLAGIRAGYLLAQAEIVERLAARRPPWSVNSLACAALAACATDRETAPRVASEVAIARAELTSGLERLPGVRVWPSAANFLLLAVIDGPGLTAALRERDIAVRPAVSFPGLDERHIRVAVRSADDNALLLAACAEILG
jgi:histidinol-phosphate/aromatic aminotransferase/cobyric acid decarboxylase-like protein